MSHASGLRVGLYARVSSEQQAQANTIASQLEALRERIQADGLTLEEELCFVDEGYSGSTLLRPGLERLRDVAAAGGLERLYVHSPDRLARKYAYQVLLVDELRRSGVEVGQAPAQMPQAVHRPGVTIASASYGNPSVRGCRLTALYGQSATQRPQPLQFGRLTTAAGPRRSGGNQGTIDRNSDEPSNTAQTNGGEP